MHSGADYLAFWDPLSGVLEGVPSGDPKILPGASHSHMGVDKEPWTDVVRSNGLPDLNPCGVFWHWTSLGRAITNTMFKRSPQKSFLFIPGDVSCIELEWTMFKASVVEAEVKRSGQEVHGCLSGRRLQGWIRFALRT